MKREEMYKILGEIDIKYLDEAMEVTPKKRTPAAILRLLLPAAALIALTCAVLVMALPMFTPPVGTVEPPQDPLYPDSSVGAPLKEQLKDLSYVSNGDQVTVTEYLGSDSVIEIPPEIGGIPVTNLDLEGDMPSDGVVYIEIRLNSSNLRNLSLPSNYRAMLNIGKDVTDLDTTLLHNQGVVCVMVDSANSVYASLDGILYSKDLKTLIACPAGSKIERLAPANEKFDTTSRTENSNSKIASDFEFAALEDLLQTNCAVFPTNLTTVRTNAFLDCSTLKSLTLPEGIKILESNAFARCGNLREMYMPDSLASVSSDILMGCNNLLYLRTSFDQNGFNTLGIELPMAVKVFTAFPQSENPKLEKEIIEFYEQAEELISWFSGFNNIPFDENQTFEGRSMVTLEGVNSKEDLQKRLSLYFTKDFEKLLDISRNQEPIFAENEGKLYAFTFETPVKYNEGERQYSFKKNESGDLTLTVRTTVNGGTVSVTVDCSYTLIKTENGFRFTSPFTLPVQAWYLFYLVELNS